MTFANPEDLSGDRPRQPSLAGGLTGAMIGRALGEAFSVESLGPADLAAAAGLCERHADLEIGLADASAVVLADRWGTTAIATFDHRHFRVLAPLAGGAFRLLPEDG